MPSQWAPIARLPISSNLGRGGNRSRLVSRITEGRAPSPPVAPDDVAAIIVSIGPHPAMATNHRGRRPRWLF